MRRALVRSGGGAKGSWQVGACQHLILERGLWFDVIAGVSAGAVNAATLAQARDPDELAAELEHLRAVWLGDARARRRARRDRDRESTRLNSSHSQISYAVFCLKKKKKTIPTHTGRDEMDS